MPTGEGYTTHYVVLSNCEWGEGHSGGHQVIPLAEGLELDLTTTVCCVLVLGEQSPVSTTGLSLSG